MDKCPTCTRPFERIEDFPFIYVDRFVRQNVPAYLDFQHQVGSGNSQKGLILGMIESYMQKVKGFEGKVVRTPDIFPPFERNDDLRVFDIKGTGYWLGFKEGRNSGDSRRSVFHILSRGPNLGRAGGPTLGIYATVATLDYEGRLTA